MNLIQRRCVMVLGLAGVVAGIAAGPAEANGATPGKSGGKTAATAPPSAMRQAAGASGAITTGHMPRMATGAAEGTAPRTAARPNANPRWAGYYYGPVTVDPGAAEWVEVYCPSGMLATSGGEKNSSFGGITLHSTYGLGGGTGWHVVVTNDSSTSASVYAYVVCFSGLTGYSQPQETVAEILPDDIDYHPMNDCPAGQQVVGGGVGTDSTAEDIGEMSPGQNPWTGLYTSWYTEVTNTGTSSAGATSQEICASGINNYSEWETYTGVAPGAYTSIDQACPAGTMIVGGGGDGGSPFRYTDSFPDANSWRIWAANSFDPATENLFAEAICGN